MTSKTSATRIVHLAGALLACTLIPSLLLAAGPSLVRDSSFENVVDTGMVAEGWETPNSPPGGINAATDARARTGHYSHELMVPESAPVDWYQVSQTVQGAAPGKTYTLSVYIETDHVRDGAGAYCSINCFNTAGTRIGVFDADAKVLGTVSKWRRQSVTAKIPAQTSKVVIIFCLHGHGTAWFDDVQFEEGDTATAYHPSAPDIAAAHRRDEEQREADAFFRASPVVVGKMGAAAILRDDLPVDGCASSPERLGRWLSAAGYGVKYLTGSEISNPFILRGPRRSATTGPEPGGEAATSPPAFNLLVLPYGGSFPAAAEKSMENYLRHGGAFISTGGYAFDSLLVRYRGKWYKPKDLPQPKTPIVPVLSFNDAGAAPAIGGKSGWDLGSDPGGTPPTLAYVPGRQGVGKALEFSVNPLRAWATASLDVTHLLPAASATGGKTWAVTRFWAKGDANTPNLSIEWDEADGSRWNHTIALTTHWKEYVLSVSDFTYWQDNPSVGRGGYGDHLHPANVTRLLLGLSRDIASPDEAHSFCIDDLAVQADPLADLRIAPPCMNTRFAPIRDSMHPTPEQIPVFDPSHPLEFVRQVRTSGGQYVVPAGLSLGGPAKGYAAVGMLGNNGWGFGPNLIRLVPLLDGIDRFGRFRGPVGSIMHAFAGYYQGASWAFFGATNRDLFGGELAPSDTPAARTVFVDTADALLRRLYLHDTSPEQSSYRPGDTARFVTTVSNFDWRPTAKAADVTVRVEGFAGKSTTPAFSEEKAVMVKPGASEKVALEWKVPADAADFYTLHTLLLAGGKPIDREDGGVVIWRPNSDWPSAHVGKDGPYFTLDGGPRFVVGCQTYWGQNGSYTARSPLAFRRDYTMMQDYGLHFSRLFVPWGDATQAAQSDAMIQLAQRHRILFYDAPNLMITPTASQLAEEEAKARAIGKRYRDVPWMMVDVCNEPSLNMADPRLVAPFNAWLKAKYGTTAALRKAWGPDAPELGKAKPSVPSSRFGDLRTRDSYLFIADVEKHWADSNREAIRAASPGRLVSVGNLQGFGYGEVSYDPRACATGLDFSDRHYYGPPAGQARELKDIDLRLLGEPLIQGECGAKDHPTYAAEDPWGMGDTPEEYDARFTSLIHHAFGIGAAALSSWHWRDPMEGIFPCGLVHADRVPRAAASIVRAMAFTFSRLRPTFRTPEVVLVMPDSHRFGGDRFAVVDAIHRCEDLLMSCQVDFAVIGEENLGKLPAGVRALVYPVPYCPPDSAVTALEAFVRKGGALYFSGDISFDTDRKLTRADRLRELAGVERIGEDYVGIARDKKAATPLTWARGAFDGVKAPDGPATAEPAISIKLAGAQALATDGQGRPVVTLNKLGRGQVLFCADPIEASADTLAWYRPLYLDFLRRAGVDRNPVTPNVASLQCFRVPLAGGGRAFVLYSYAKSPVKATLTLPRKTAGGVAAPAPERISLEIAPNSPGLVVAAADGTVTAIEAEGEVRRDGKLLASIRGHAIIESLDGKDVAASRQLLILPWPGMYGLAPQPGKPGEVAMASLAGMRVELGELRDTRWSRLEPMKPSGGRLTYDEEESRNVILAAAPGEFMRAAHAVEALTLAR